MAAPTNLLKGHHAVALAVQADGLTENTTDADTNWMWVDCEVVLTDRIKFGRRTTELRRPQPVPGAIGRPLAGGRSGGEVTLRYALKSQPTTVWAALADAVASPELAVLINAIGASYLLQKVEANVAAAGVGTTVKLTDVTSYEVGCLLPWADSVDQDPVTGMGWITTADDDAGPPQEITIAGTPAAVSSNGDDTLSTLTGAVTLDQPSYYTGRIVGHGTTDDLRLVSCFPESTKITLQGGEVIVVEVTFSYSHWRWDADSKGGLYDPDTPTRARTPGRYVDLGGGDAWYAYRTLPALTAGNGGRTLIDGSAYAKGFGGAIEIEIRNVVNPMTGPGGIGGDVTKIVSGREVTVKASLPFDTSTDITAETDLWTYKYEQGTPVELDIQLGTTAGQLFATYFPALYQARQPELVTVGEEVVGFSLEMQPSVPSGDVVDDGVSAAENTVARFAVG